jgi:hypothetical protein
MDKRQKQMSQETSHPLIWPSLRRSGRLNDGKFFLVATLVFFSVALTPFLGEGNRNLALIFFMVISPLFALTSKATRTDLYLYFFMASILVLPALMNPESVRWSTILFSQMFAITFIAFKNTIRRTRMPARIFTKAVRFILVAYLLTLLVQQFCVLTGLPIFNVSNYNPMTPWKLNALSAEPSHSGRIIGILMFAYLSLRESEIGEKLSISQALGKDKYLWGGFLWAMTTMQSATALIFLPLVLSKFANRRNALAIFAFVPIVLLLVQLLASEEMGRVLSIASAATTLDYNELLSADRSGAMRIAPMLILLERLELFSYNGLFGNGIDSVSTFMSTYINGVRQNFTGGGLFQFWYEYGFISFILFAVFSCSASGAFKSPTNFIFWTLLVFLVGVNNQITWLYLILATTIQHYSTSRPYT